MDGYNVRQLPASMQELVWDFGMMTQDQEREYIACMLQKMTTESLGGASGANTSLLARRLTQIIMYSQVYLLFIHTCQRNLAVPHLIVQNISFLSVCDDRINPGV